MFKISALKHAFLKFFTETNTWLYVMQKEASMCVRPCKMFTGQQEKSKYVGSHRTNLIPLERRTNRIFMTLLVHKSLFYIYIIINYNLKYVFHLISC